MRWFFLSLLFPLAASGEVCLRAPQTSAEGFQAWRKKQPECAESVKEILAPFQGDADEELDEIFSLLKKTALENQAKILESFLEKKKERFWTPRDIEMIPLILERWEGAEKRKGKLEALQAWRDLIERPPSRRGFEGLSSRDGGWSDFVLFANGQELRDETLEKAGRGSAVGSEIEKAQWVLLSSLYQPIIHWGSKAELLKRADQGRKTWLGGDCENPKLFFTPVKDLRYLFLFPDRCVARWPAGPPIKALADPPVPKLPTDRPRIKRPTIGFWIVSALAAGVMINHLSSKKLVIQPTRW